MPGFVEDSLPPMVEAERANPPCSHPLRVKGQACDLTLLLLALFHYRLKL
jgi:hypothetical protein